MVLNAVSDGHCTGIIMRRETLSPKQWPETDFNRPIPEIMDLSHFEEKSKVHPFAETSIFTYLKERVESLVAEHEIQFYRTSGGHRGLMTDSRETK